MDPAAPAAFSALFQNHSMKAIPILSLIAGLCVGAAGFPTPASGTEGVITTVAGTAQPGSAGFRSFEGKP